jgi:twitching motility protein PilT
MDLDGLLDRLDQIGGSDLHLKFGVPASVRADGHIFSLGGLPLTAQEMETALDLVTGSAPGRREEFDRSGEVDTSYITGRGQRFRVSVFRQRGQISMALRRIPTDPRSLDELKIPKGAEQLADVRHGLVIVAGATGSGKSTTLAGLVSRLNESRPCHIVTIEDPIEVLYTDSEAFISQREVGIDTVSFSQALRRVLRQDPDVIVIGEMRDQESAEAALSASESGHLVLSTMHTADTIETIDRIIEFFPSHRHDSARNALASVLQGVIAQRLLPKKGGGQVPAVEILINTPRAGDLIRDEDRTAELADVINEGEVHGMQSFDNHLVQLVLNGEVDRYTALAAASVPHDCELKLERALRNRERGGATAGQVPRRHDPGLRRTGKEREPSTETLRRAPLEAAPDGGTSADNGHSGAGEQS